MALKSSFFNSINGDRRYDARVFAEYFASFIGNGVFPNPSTNLQVVEGGNMTTIIRSGKAWINGYFLINDNDYVLTHDNADGVLKRIDRIVLRLNYVARQIEIVIKKGTFASSPTAPTLQRDNDMHELAIADVLINNGATQITQANITDTRLNTALCGVVHGVVNQVDTTTIFNQYQSWFENFVDEMNEVLDGDVAANLLTSIGKVEREIGTESLQTQAQTIKEAINEVFRAGNNVKADMVAALLALDSTLPITNNSNWEEIETTIGQISTGKKDANGSGSLVLSGQAQQSVYSGYIDLPFVPRIIYLEGKGFFVNDTQNSQFIIKVNDDLTYKSTQYAYDSNNRVYIDSLSADRKRFRIRYYGVGLQNRHDYTWYAYEK